MVSLTQGARSPLLRNTISLPGMSLIIVQYTDVGVFGVFIHELANSIGERYGLADTFGGYRAQNARRGINDADVGAAFESCVFGGLVGL